MLHLVRTTSSDGGLKKILAGLRFLEKLQWVSAIVTQADWALVNAAGKYHERRGMQAEKVWGTMEMFHGLCAAACTMEEWELVALSTLSMAYGLRAKEAFTAYYDREQVVWTGAKGRRGRCPERCGAWTAMWSDFLQLLRARHGHHPQRPAFIATKQRPHDLIQELARRPRSPSTLLRWHSWRPYGAATLQKMGAPTSALLMWGGWHAPVVLRVYTEAPQGWTLSKLGPLPVPGISEAGEPSWRLIPGTVYWPWGPWRRRELTRPSSVPAPLARESAAGLARAKPAATADGRTSLMVGDAGAKYRASCAVSRSCREYNAGDETWCAVRYSTSSTVCSKYAGVEYLYEPSWRSCARWLTQDS